MPDFSTFSRRQNTLNVVIPCRAKEGLHLLIDSTGIKVEGEGEWLRRNHGGSKCRIWRKIHIAVDEHAVELRAIEVASSTIGDAPVLPDLLDQIAPQEQITSVTADGAADTRSCHNTIAARLITADILVPQERPLMGKPTTDDARVRNDALQRSKHLGLALWREWSGYHRRSCVEAKMNCIKLLGQKLMARSFDRQAAEVRFPAAILNRFTANGTPTTTRVA